MDQVTVQLKQGLQSTQDYKDFKAVLEFKDMILDKWRKQNTVGDSEFETVKLAMEKQFKIQGLEEFFTALYEMAYNDDAKL